MGDLPVAINGFGRIGRLVFRAAVEKGGIEIKAINDLTDAKTLAHLLKYDSTQGRFDGEVAAEEDHLVVNGKGIRISPSATPPTCPGATWGSMPCWSPPVSSLVRMTLGLILMPGRRVVISPQQRART